MEHSGKQTCCHECKKSYGRKYSRDNRKRLNKYRNEFYRKHPDYRRNLNLIRYYGITLKDKEDILLKQEGRCANKGCNRELDLRSKLCNLDHCHATGRIRGVLCGPCNLALGNIHESIAKAEGLIEYIKTRVNSDAS